METCSKGPGWVPRRREYTPNAAARRMTKAMASEIPTPNLFSCAAAISAELEGDLEAAAEGPESVAAEICLAEEGEEGKRSGSSSRCSRFKSARSSAAT